MRFLEILVSNGFFKFIKNQYAERHIYIYIYKIWLLKVAFFFFILPNAILWNASGRSFFFFSFFESNLQNVHNCKLYFGFLISLASWGLSLRLFATMNWYGSKVTFWPEWQGLIFLFHPLNYLLIICRHEEQGIKFKE